MAMGYFANKATHGFPDRRMEASAKSDSGLTIPILSEYGHFNMIVSQSPSISFLRDLVLSDVISS